MAENAPVDFLTEALVRKISQFNNVENVEVEARLCLITSKTSKKDRLRLQIDSAAILTAPHNIQVGVDKNSYERLLASFRESGLPSCHVVDMTTAFNDGERIEKDLEGKVISFLKKKKMHSMDISIPYSPYDIRVGVATETPLDISTIPEEIPKDAFVRQRNRTTFTISENMKADFTVVGKTNCIYEVEIEMTFPKLEVSPVWVASLMAEMKKLIDILRQRPTSKPVSNTTPAGGSNTQLPTPAEEAKV